ncbi:UNVERIFIED_CONTAM: hypothetical protein Slati_0820300 [Sesamum latifolium]|uniref:Uncharacterized protein n=1 Tax=Sesamum latifolium TaxID=2727402 RepID=A0AAW2XRA8_9LAMI
MSKQWMTRELLKAPALGSKRGVSTGAGKEITSGMTPACKALSAPESSIGGTLKEGKLLKLGEELATKVRESLRGLKRDTFRF